MEFNSLDAQREACESYVASQKAEGWLLLPDRYDDGGVPGGTLERPALQRLIADIEARRVEVVVVYKIDRLSRALSAKLVELPPGPQLSSRYGHRVGFNTKAAPANLGVRPLLSRWPGRYACETVPARRGPLPRPLCPTTL
jgi:hypothetical protein